MFFFIVMMGFHSVLKWGSKGLPYVELRGTLIRFSDLLVNPYKH